MLAMNSRGAARDLCSSLQGPTQSECYLCEGQELSTVISAVGMKTCAGKGHRPMEEPREGLGGGSLLGSLFSFLFFKKIIYLILWTLV